MEPLVCDLCIQATSEPPGAPLGHHQRAIEQHRDAPRRQHAWFGLGGTGEHDGAQTERPGDAVWARNACVKAILAGSIGGAIGAPFGAFAPIVGLQGLVRRLFLCARGRPPLRQYFLRAARQRRGRWCPT